MFLDSGSGSGACTAWVTLFFPTNIPPKKKTHGQLLRSQGPICGHRIYITPPILGVPSAQRGKKITNGYVTLAVSGGHMWATDRIIPAVSGVPNAQRGDKCQK